MSYRIISLACVLLMSVAACQSTSRVGETPKPAAMAPIRYPATPLIAHDPYFSVWSFSDNLPGDWSKHWTGAVNAMCIMVRIDGKPYLVAGNPRLQIDKLKQKNVEVFPTRTIYTFEDAGINLTLTFLTPALLHNLDVLSRPVTYVVPSAKSTDGQSHSVQFYLDATGEWVVNKPDQQVKWDRLQVKGMTTLRMGSKDQPVLKKAGDDLRIDWGHLLLATPGTSRGSIGSDETVRVSFASDGSLPDKDEDRQPREARDKWPVMASVIDFGSVKSEAVTRRMMIAYDDEYGIEYMKKPLRPWWKRDGMTTDMMLSLADREYDKLAVECARFDATLLADLTRMGGEKYAALCSLAYRQCLAAHKLVASEDGKTPLYFSKENFSNGCIDTVDVTYPSSPFFLLFSPTLLKGQLTPIMDYSASAKWKFPFAPHDLGTYPKANGQVYGGGERDERDQMPVEETGNMIIMITALAKVEGNADYAKLHWATLEKWAAYLAEKGLDPENQLCTDDFAGHLAHNTNLSIKAIVALAGYAQLAEQVGKKDEAIKYRKLAEQMTAQWQKMADDGDHYRLTFDKAGTWSQKYNLVWDKLLGMKLFPADVATKEIAFYKKKINVYGLPLDSRKTYTKLDWIMWTATMTQNDADFKMIAEPCYEWANKTPSRVPLTDWYDTVSGKQSGFQARSPVGGMFIKMLADEATWKKYATMK